MKALYALTGILALLIAAPAYAANPPAPTNLTPFVGASVKAGSQVWWRKAGIVIPSMVGEHTHVDASIPTGIVDGTLVLPVDVTQHNGTGRITWIRACRESSYCQTWSMSLGPCQDCTTHLTLPINLSAWPTGRQELRLSANVAVNGEGNRLFQSTGWPVNVRATSPCPRCAVFWTARGWYSAHQYQNAELESDPLALASGQPFNAYLHPGDGGLLTRLAGVYVDSHFHDGDAGIVVKQTASFRGTLRMPTLAPGPHKLALLSSDGFEAGVLTFGFEVP